MGACQLGRGPDLFVRGSQLAVANIITDRAGEQVRGLQNHADPGLDQVQGIIFVIVSPDKNLSALGLEEAAHQVDDRRFPTAGGPNQGDRFSTLNMQVEVLQHGLLFFIIEVDIVEDDITLYGAGIDRARPV